MMVQLIPITEISHPLCNHYGDDEGVSHTDRDTTLRFLPLPTPAQSSPSGHERTDMPWCHSPIPLNMLCHTLMTVRIRHYNPLQRRRHTAKDMTERNTDTTAGGSETGTQSSLIYGTEAEIRQEPVASRPDQILPGQHPPDIFGWHAAPELIEDIRAAGMGMYLLAAVELEKPLPGRLSKRGF